MRFLDRQLSILLYPFQGLDSGDERVKDKTKWRGRNWMGNLLMQLRNEFRVGVRLFDGHYIFQNVPV